jgi:mRNA-degrading endonuclease RelE of RelBE toxin-antitoxin system
MSASSLRMSIVWTEEARDSLRLIDRAVALEILHCIDRFLLTRKGDIKKLQPPETGYRLRCGSYRVSFDRLDVDAIEVIYVEHRKQAYR